MELNREIVKVRLRKLGLFQKDLAEYCGITVESMRNILRDKNPVNPGKRTVDLIERFLKEREENETNN